jgi:methionyl aminopeptidase
MGFGRRVHIKTDDEVELLRESSLLVGKTLAAVASRIRPGVTTLELDAIAEEFIRDCGAEPGFKGYGGFPNSLCTSVNEAVVHGIPDNRPLEEGDIVSVDCGVLKNEFYGDSAYTFAVGEIPLEVQQLLEVTKECLQKAIEQAVVGKRIGDIGFACQQHAEQHGYGVVRELVGHGLGRSLHEAPEVPNYGRRGNGPRLMDGMVLAIEPMINLGRKEVFHEEDGWTIVTSDRKVSAHFEHDIVVRKDQADVLSSFDEIEKVLQQQKRKV